MCFISRSTILLLSVFFAVSSAAVTYEIQNLDSALLFDNAFLKGLVNSAFNLSGEKTPYSKVSIKVYTKQNGKENYLAVVLYKTNLYTVEFYRIEITPDGKIGTITPGYYEQSSKDEDCKSGCPDTSVTILIGNMVNSGYPLADAKATAVTNALKAVGIKAVQLRGTAESRTAVKAYLKCPKLRVWGRLGHGALGGAVQLGNEEVWSFQTVDSTKADMKGKIYPFNCCYVGGTNVFANHVMSAGAQFMCAGDNVEIMAGTAEPAWEKFMLDICKNNKEVVQAFKDNLANAQDRWGYQAVSGKIYVFANTKIENASKNATTDSWFIWVTPFSVVFTYNGAIGKNARFSIYDLTGKMVYQNRVCASKINWNMENSSGGHIAAGTYVCILENSASAAVKKLFTVIK